LNIKSSAWSLCKVTNTRGFEMASIIITSGEQKGEYLPLGRRTNVIGRAEALPMQILDDLISRKHLRIRYDENTNEHCAEDMDSKHGVFINNRRISERTALKEGDQIHIGETTLLFTEKDFDNRESALEHYKKIGERQRPTRTE
jgi:pSer/pThr/pTyr-binding forkhead associated (FHA) protein